MPAPPPPTPDASALGFELHETISWALFITHNAEWMLDKCKCNLVKLNIKESHTGNCREHSCQPAHVGSRPHKTFISSLT